MLGDGTYPLGLPPPRRPGCRAAPPSLYAGDLVIRDDGTVARPLALFRVDQSRLTFESYVGVDGRALAAPPETTP